MLYHVPDIDRALAEIRRVLRPGGRLYTATVGAGHLRDLVDLVERFAPEGEYENPPAMSFTLESGPDLLSRRFARVTLHRYEDGLAVTKAEPLVAYVLSGRAGAVLTGERLAALAGHVEREIAENGAIHIGKDTGLFEAERT
jgi:SAM-dependent methyltransferase